MSGQIHQIKISQNESGPEFDNSNVDKKSDISEHSYIYRELKCINGEYTVKYLDIMNEVTLSRSDYYEKTLDT